MRRLIAAFAVLAGAAAAPAAAQEPRAVYVPAVDYPPEIRPGATGYLVRVRYELDRTGRVARCTLARSSGQPSLDSETCRILQARARIRPERGRMRGQLVFHWLGEASLSVPHTRGEPLPYSLAQAISDSDYPLEAIRRGESGTVGFEVTVSHNGAPRACRVTQSSGSEALDRRTCELVMERSAYIPATDGSGPLGGMSHGRIRWILPDG